MAELKRNLSQSGKVEILKRFDMLECKAMATPMETNLKLLAYESYELVDMTW